MLELTGISEKQLNYDKYFTFVSWIMMLHINMYDIINNYHMFV